MDDPSLLAATFAVILPHVNERQRRLLLAAEAQALGRGGITQVARAAGVSRPTIHHGLAELTAPSAGGWVRRHRAGRRRSEERAPPRLADLEALVDPATHGDPMAPRRWTGKSTRRLAAALSGQGHQVSAWGVRRLLHEADDRLQAPATVLDGGRQPDQDAQVGYRNEQSTAFLAARLPVISVERGSRVAAHR
jgi:hypothetical protein